MTIFNPSAYIMYNARHLARSLGSALAGLFGIRVRDTAKLRNAIEFL